MSTALWVGGGQTCVINDAMNFGVQSGHDITDDVTQRTREHAFDCMMGVL